jgi:steroid delta-isomerase-like uncharacterized protein
VSVDANIAAVRRHHDLLRDYDEAEADAIWAEDLVFREPQQVIRGRDGMKARFQAFRAAFRDAAVTLDDVLAQDDKVAIRYELEGIHHAPFAGMPATGKRVTLSGMAIFRLADGRIVEGWGCADFLGFLRQLGALPAPGPPAEGGGRG